MFKSVALALVTGVSCAPIAPRVAVSPAGSAARTAMGGPVVAEPTSNTAAQFVRPSQRAATRYGSAAGAELRDRLRADPLRAAVVGEIRRQAREARLPEPAADARLDAVADDLAASLRGPELPPFEVVDFLMSHYGLVEAAPNLLLARASSDADTEVRDQIGAQMPALFRSTRIAQVGVGIQRTKTEMTVVVALQERNVDLGPVPRTLALGGALTVAGKLLGGHRQPEIIVTGPDGQTREIPSGADSAGVGFRAPVRCDRGVGRYQIEVTGNNKLGTAVVANFPVFCGRPAPSEVPRSSSSRTAPWTVAEAEARMLEVVNRDRRVARLAPVSIDKKLSDVARAHSQDMADHDFVGHISPTTGNAMDRVRRAGVEPELLLENVGRAYTPDEAQGGLMQSPGHRANILERRVTRIGIGIVMGKPLTGTSPMLVTQLFM